MPWYYAVTMDIGVWGDSITYGACDANGLGWVGRLRVQFPMDHYVSVYNRGVCGDTSADLLNRFEAEIQSTQVAVVVLAIGINDCKSPSNSEKNIVSQVEFRANIQELVVRAQKYTSCIIVVGLTRVDESKTTYPFRFTNEQIEIYNNVLKEVSLNESIPFIDMIEILDSAADLYDGLHPNASGYRKMCDAISRSIQPVLNGV
jgi:lysophospholipase L1-like esterase